MADVAGGLPVQAETLGQPASRRPSVQGIGHDNEREGAHSSVPTKIMPWFRKSTEFSRCQRTSADEPEYFCLPASIPRRIRRPITGRSWVVIAVLLLWPLCQSALVAAWLAR
jgi:hypothetical protein